MINILYEDNHLLVVEKPVNVLVQADDTKDLDFLTMLKQYIKETYEKPGNVYLGLVHRLDRTVGGVMVFAKTSKAASRLSEQIRTHQMDKLYHAVIHGAMDQNKGTLQDYLLKDEKPNLSRVDPKGKEAILDYEVLAEKSHLTLVKISLKTGRSHQIRVQFASRGHALVGDKRYGKDSFKGNITLFASTLSFYHPVTKEKMVFSLPLPKGEPWRQFNEK